MSDIEAMSPSDRLFKLLRQFEYDKPYSFKLPTTEQGARKYIQRMRVCLSRLRSEAKDRGRAIRPFKIRVVDVKSVDPLTGTLHEVTLVRTYSSHAQEAEAELDAILKDANIIMGDRV